jgi:hypothetical protein
MHRYAQFKFTVFIPTLLDAQLEKSKSHSDFLIFNFHWPNLKIYWPRTSDQWVFMNTVPTTIPIFMQTHTCLCYLSNNYIFYTKRPKKKLIV